MGLMVSIVSTVVSITGIIILFFLYLLVRGLGCYDLLVAVSILLLRCATPGIELQGLRHFTAEYRYKGLGGVRSIGDIG